MHCFVYGGRLKQQKLEQYCEKVYYYKRNLWVLPFTLTPYIALSRKNNQLLKELCLNNYPILFEGLHTCFFLNHPLLSGRKKMVRMHNIEHHYYRHLFKAEPNLLKKIYFFYEAVLLKKYQRILQHADYIFAISPLDYNYLHNIFKQVIYLPVFHGNTIVCGGMQAETKFALYHGKLSVSENNDAALYLIKQVFSSIPFFLVIAGNNPSAKLIKEVNKYPNIKLIQVADDSALNKLIKQAHVNVLPTFQATGIKLKLLNALYNGKYVIANSSMVYKTGLDNLCFICNSASEFKMQISKLMQTDFNADEIKTREQLLEQHFNDTKNVKIILTAVS